LCRCCDLAEEGEQEEGEEEVAPEDSEEVDDPFRLTRPSVEAGMEARRCV
jgi:hypothetical protein